MSLNGRSKPLVRYVVRPAAGSGLGTAPLGIVVTHGADEPLVLLVAALRWRMSKAQLVATKWDDCPLLTRAIAARAEQQAATALVAECQAAIATADHLRGRVGDHMLHSQATTDHTTTTPPTTP